MIEKFSGKELNQIMKELGLSSAELSKNNRIYKAHALFVEKADCLKEFGKKPVDVHGYIMKIIDFALNNFCLSSNRIQSSIPSADICEYKKMYNEIFEIIKVHNREWQDNFEHQAPSGKTAQPNGQDGIL